MNIVFRVDSSREMGSGHLMRCLTLADALRSQGEKVAFITREHTGNFILKLEENGHVIYRLPAPSTPLHDEKNLYLQWLGVTVQEDAMQSLEILKGQAFDWLVVDHYGLDKYWEQLVRPVVGRILVIDDLANREHCCDMLLDQNYFGDVTTSRYHDKVDELCQCLLGPRYALLQPVYKQLHDNLPQRNGFVCRVLIFFGGSDLNDQTSKVLSALNDPELSHLFVDVVLGQNHPNSDAVLKLIQKRSKTNLYQNLSSLAGLMVRADFFIGAGGATTWERMCLGLPSLVFSVADNQNVVTDLLVSDGYQLTMSLEFTWLSMISKVIKQSVVIKELEKKSRQLVDGFGCNRVVSLMLENKNV